MDLPEDEKEHDHRDKRIKICNNNSNKSQLILCNMEMYRDRRKYRPPPAKVQPWDSSYVIHSINLSDLLTSSSSNQRLKFWQLARMDDKDLLPPSFKEEESQEKIGLPGYVSCGVLGSKIVFSCGRKPNYDPDGYGPPFEDHTYEAYAFDMLDPDKGIVTMPGGALNGAKCDPLMFQFSGKLYVLSYKWPGQNSFEVFDPQLNTWSVLPPYPDAGLCIPVFNASYVVVGTKLFISNVDRPVCCFDFASPLPEWRRVPSLCRGRNLPFERQALAVDLPQPEHSNKKLLFSGVDRHTRTGLTVHFMTLDENEETIRRIFATNLPEELPHNPKLDICHFFYLGGNTVLVLITTFGGRPSKSGVYTVATVQFQFEFDISKVDKDKKNSITLLFHHPRVVKYRSSPHCFGVPHTIGCFLL